MLKRHIKFFVTALASPLVVGLVAAGLAACSPSEPAEPDTLVDFVGQWRFKTTGDYEGYVSGKLQVGRSEDGEVTCKLTVYQSEFGSAVERCRISREGVLVRIKIEEVVTSSVPKWRQESFTLQYEGDEMTGQVKIVVDFPVQFKRKQ